MDPATQELNDNLAEGIRQHAESREFHRTEGESIAQAKADMVESAAAKEEELSEKVDNFISGARKLHPKLRVSKNQLLALDSNGRPEGWGVNNAAGATFTTEFTVSPDGTLWADRPAAEQEFLTALGRPNLVNSVPSGNLNVLRVSWTNSGHWLMFQQTLNTSRLFEGCMAKLLSGSLGGGFTNGITDEWSICGFQTGPLPIGYSHAHSITGDPGEALIALPATILGDHHKDDGWGFYTRIPLASANTLGDYV